jgi:hypothetical protein
LNIKKLTMKKSTILKMTAALAILFVGYANSWGQTNPVPTSTLGTLYKQTTNIADPVGPVASETPDLITTGTRVPYLVIPDATLNPTWAAAAAADATITTGINSTFTWAVPAGISTTFVPASNTGHFIQVNVDGAATTAGNITVQEVNATCSGSTTTIGLRVVAKPTATAVTPSAASICASGTNNSLNQAIPTFTITRSNDAAILGDPTIRVKATLVLNDFVAGDTKTIFTDQILGIDNTTWTINATDLANAISAGKTSLGTIGSGADLDTWGSYVLTLTYVSDKISRKDLTPVVLGYFSASGSATYIVSKTPTTGPIYHLPNN